MTRFTRRREKKKKEEEEEASPHSKSRKDRAWWRLIAGLAAVAIWQVWDDRRLARSATTSAPHYYRATTAPPPTTPETQHAMIGEGIEKGQPSSQPSPAGHEVLLAETVATADPQQLPGSESLAMASEQSAATPIQTQSLQTTMFHPQDSCEAPPTKEYMPLTKVRAFVVDWHNQTCADKDECTFTNLGQALLANATIENEMLLSVQVGGNDGIEADPIHWMYVEGNDNLYLTHWYPVVVEPVPYNHERLQKTYKEIVLQKHLKCLKLANAVISYDPDQAGTCTFCHFNMSKDNDMYPHCRDHPEWMKTNLGTLDCDYSRDYFQENFDCIAQAKIACGSLGHLLQEQYQIPSASVAFLNLDIEGYEHMVLRGFLQELQSSLDDLPPILHFEHKVMKAQDLHRDTTNLQDLVLYLTSLGYHFFDQGEDFLALLLGGGLSGSQNNSSQIS